MGPGYGDQLLKQLAAVFDDMSRLALVIELQERLTYITADFPLGKPGLRLFRSTQPFGVLLPVVQRLATRKSLLDAAAKLR